MDGDAALCVRRSTQQSHGPWFCSAVTLWTIGRRSPTLHVAPAVGSQCCRSVWVEGGGGGGGCGGWDMKRRKRRPGVIIRG